MADISVLARLVGSIPKNVDIASNTLVTTSIKVGGGVTNTELTKAILDRLVSLQNGSDVGASYHSHDTLYYRESEINSTTTTSGASLVGVNGTPTNYSPSAANVQKHLEAIDAALATAGGSAFSDAMFEVYDDGDITKKIKFQAAGISTATSRTITMPDANVNLADVNNAILKDGSRAFTANQPMGGFKLTNLAAGSTAGDSVRYEQAILTSGVNAFAANQSFGGFKATNLADPTASQDAVTLAYLQAYLNGLTPKAPARVATTANITLSGTQTIDGVAVVAGNRVLVKDQSTASQNGIYVVAAGAWSRSTDMDSLSPVDEVNGAWVAIQEGTQAGQVFVQYGTVTTLGTDPLNWAFYNPIAGLIGGDMITFAGSTFSVDLATVSGLESTNPGGAAGQLRIKLEASNPTLMIDGSNQLAVKYAAGSALTQGSGGLAVLVDNSTIEISTSLRVKDAGITINKLASNSVDENKIVSTSFSSTGAITGGGGTKIQVEVDGSSIERSSNALRVKSGAYDQLTITGGSGSAAAVQEAPMVKRRSMVAGEAFSANVTYMVRLAINGETAGRVYKADYDASSSNKFYVIGFIQPTSAVSAGGSVDVIIEGSITLLSGDTAFGATKIGEPVHLKAAGAFDAVSNITYADLSNLAAVRVGIVETTTKIHVQAMQLNGIA